MTNQEQKIIDYAKAHQRSRDFVGVFEENIEYVKLGGYVSESGKVVYLEHTADMMKNSVLYVGAPDVSDVPAEYETEVTVCEDDTITAGKKLLDDGFCPVLLSFANRSTPGWGVWNGYPSQENGSLRRSDLFASIFQFDRESAKLAGIPVKPGNQYPMAKNTGGVYSPGVTFFRTGGRKGFQLLDDPYQLSVISMSAIYSPEIDENGRLTDLMIYGYTQKIRTMFRIALSNGHNAIVLGAWGCGDAGTPPEQLAEIFRKILTEDEFRNKFSKVVFAVFMNDLALNAFEKTFGTRENDLFINETGNCTMEQYDVEKNNFENLTGEQWSQLLCKHPEYADRCDWSKLECEDWGKLLAVQPQFAEYYWVAAVIPILYFFPMIPMTFVPKTILRKIPFGFWLKLLDKGHVCRFGACGNPLYNPLALVSCPWHYFVIIFLWYILLLFLLPLAKFSEEKPLWGDFFRDFGKLIVVFFIKILFQIWALVCFIIQPSVILSVALWSVGYAAFYWQKVIDRPVMFWWGLLCGWGGVYYSMRNKNPESKWKWDIANVIAWVLLMPCSIIGYMIYRGVF